MYTQPVNVATKCTSMPEKKRITINAIYNIQPIRNITHSKDCLSMYQTAGRRVQKRNGGKTRVTLLTQFMHATLHMSYFINALN